MCVVGMKLAESISPATKRFRLVILFSHTFESVESEPNVYVIGWFNLILELNGHGADQVAVVVGFLHG